MGTNGQRKGFGFDEFFRRISRSSEETPDAKKNSKNGGYDVAAQVESLELERTSVEKTISKTNDEQKIDQPETSSRMEKTGNSEEIKETNEEPRDNSKKLSRMKTTQQSKERKKMMAEESLTKSSKRQKRRISEDSKRPNEESKDDFGKLSKMETPRESKESRRMDEESKRYSRKLPRREKRETSVISQQNGKLQNDSRKSSRVDKLRASQKIQRMILEPEDNRRMSSRVEKLGNSEGSKENDEEQEGYLREPSKMEELRDSKEIVEKMEALYDDSRNLSRIEKQKDFENIKKTDEELKYYPRKSSKKQKSRDSEVSNKMDEDQEEYSRKSSIMEKRRDSELRRRMDEEPDSEKKSSRMEKHKDLEVSEQRDQEPKGHSRKSSIMQKPRDSEESKKMDEEQEEYSRKSSRTEEPRDSEVIMNIGEGSKDYSRKSSKMQKLRGSVISKGTNEEAKDYSRKPSIIQKIRDSDANKRTSREQADYPRKSQTTQRMETSTDFEVSKKMTPEPKSLLRKSSKMEKGDKNEEEQGKLSELINNSIKEAVMNIVKVGVCSPIDSLVAHEKDVSKLIPLSMQAEVHQGKEKKPAISNNLLPPMTAIPRRSSSYERSASDRRDRESHRRVIKDRQAKSIIKRKEKMPSEASGKLPSQTKAKGHFKTDNRRMTGNVNIYICSEATERTQEPPENEKENDLDFEESETSSNVKTSNSSLSASTSKLLAALRKKKLKNPNDQLLGCLCETPEDSAGHKFVDNIDDHDDEISCLCDDRETEFPDSESFSSRDVCFCEDRKFNDEDEYVSFVAERKSNREKLRPYSRYNRNYSRSWTTANTPNNLNNWKSIKTKAKANISKKDFGEGCSCCDYKRCRRDRTLGVQRRKTWKTLPETRVRKSSNETHKFPCIIEEEAESCCDKKTCQGNYVSCTKRPVNDAPSNIEDEEINRERTPCRYEPSKFEDNGTPKRETMIHHESSIVRMNEVANPVNEKDNGESAMLKSHECDQVLMDVSPKRISAVDEGSNDSPKRNSAEEEPSNPINQVTDEKSENSPRNSSPIETATPSMFPDGRRNSSFLRRSIDRLLSMVRGSKVEETLDPEDGRKSAQPISIPQPKPQDIDDPVTRIEKTIQLPPSPTRLPVIPQKSTAESRSKSRISIAIAKRKSLAAMSKSTLQSRASPLLGMEVDNQQDERKSRSSSIKAQRDHSQEKETNGSSSPKKEYDNYQEEKPNGSSSPKTEDDYCQERATKGSFSIKTPEDDRESKNLCESLDDQLPIVQNQLCKCSVPKIPNTSNTECSRTIETRVSPSADKDSAEHCDRCVGRNGSMNERNCQCESDWVTSCCCCCFTDETKLEKLSENQEHPKPEHFGSGIHQRSTSLQEHRCCQRCLDLNNVDGPKSMICVYCDNQREKCICNVASQECSRSSICLDVSNWDHHQMVYAGEIGEPAISGSAWTSRRDIWRGFSKATAECEDDIEREEPSRNSKPYGAEELPYQKGTAFSNVMNELQQRISGSVCCNGCGMVPCRCRYRDEETKRTVDAWPRLSTTKEVKTRGQKRSRSKSPNSCKCGPIPRRKTVTLQSGPMRICDGCNTSPCRCRPNSESPPILPRAKCYYCKRWPCACLPIIAASNARPIRNVDSSNRRTRERSDTI